MYPHINPKQSPQVIEKFDEWNEEKKFLHTQELHERYINPREIWYVKMGLNIGNEQNGKKVFRRPILVMKRIGNMYFCLPLTKQWKEDSKFYLQLKTAHFHEEAVGKSFLIISQGRVFDKRRFMHLKGKIGHEEFLQIKNLLKMIYF